MGNLEGNLKKLNNENYKGKIIICGDINLCLKEQTNNRVIAYIDMLLKYSLAQITDIPTRITRCSSSIIDHIFLSDVLMLQARNYVIRTDVSDHCALLLVIQSKNKLSKVRPTKNNFIQYIRIYSQTNIEKFCKRVEEVIKLNWHFDDVLEYKINILENAITTAFEEILSLR